MGRTKHFFTALRDFVVLAAIVAALNYLLDPRDPGWMGLNPTPWLLPAVLVGARYGFSSGLLAGMAVGAFLAGTKSHLEGLEINEMVRENAYFFLSIAVAGAAAGEIGRLLRQRSATIRKTNHKLNDENTRLRYQLQLTDETRHQLQQQLVLFNAPMCALDQELSTLFTYPQEEFAPQLLRMLHRLTNLASAGIYLVDRDTLTQAAVLHPTPPLAPMLLLGNTPLAEKALSSGALASVTDATALNEAQPFLAALPWLDHVGRKGVLLVQDMPLEAFTLQNLARLELILSWATAIAVLRQTFVSQGNPVHPTSNDDFKVLLSEAHDADRIHGVPSALLRFDFESVSSLRASLQQFPNTAVTTCLDEEHSVAVLLPFSGETEALQTRRDVVAAHPTAKAQHYLITGGSSPSDLWSALQRS